MTNSALLVMDYQDEITAHYDTAVLVPRVKGVIAAARKASIPVIFVVVGFRPGHPEVSPANKGFSALKQSGRLVNPKVLAALEPLPEEPVTIKKRISAFAGSDLDVLLRGCGARHLILCGISTSGVVLSTVRAAGDMDFELTVIADCCADGDAEVHNLLLQKVFPRQARVIDAATIIGELETAAA